jgi:hypothetical protein
MPSLLKKFTNQFEVIGIHDHPQKMSYGTTSTKPNEDAHHHSNLKDEKMSTLNRFNIPI